MSTRSLTRKLMPAAAVLLVALILAALAAGCGGKSGTSGTNGGDSGEKTALAWPTPYFDNQRTGRSPYSGPATNEVRWTYGSGGATSRSCWVTIGKDGGPLAGFNGKAVSIDAASGAGAWEFPAAGADFTTCRVADDGTIYTSSGNNVYALSPAGKQKWSYDLGSIADEPALDDGVIYAGSSGGRLVALDGDGELEWEYKAPGSIRSPSFDRKGNLYCSAATLALYCIDRNGKKKWEFKPAGDLPVYEGLFQWANTLDVPSIGDDGTVYAGTFVTPGIASNGQQIPDYAVPLEAKIYAVSSAGAKKWEYTHPGSQYSIHTPTIARDGTLYAGTSCWKVISLDPDGKLVWEFDTQEEQGECPSTYSPPIGKDGLLYAATTNSRIYCITPEGTEKWRYDANNPWLPGPSGQPMMGGSNNFTPPAIGSDGTLYSLLAEGKVFAFKPAGAQK